MISLQKKAALYFAAIGISLSLASPALAEKPEWAGNGKHKEDKHEKHKDKHEKHKDKHKDKHEAEQKREAAQFHWDQHHRQIVSEYYGKPSRKGHCPPGLAKKNNGCLPPGQAKKWHRGERLVVKYYELPPTLQVHLPPPPPKHRYVQVAGDILLIAIGTSIVVDAIEDLLR
jgi:Ni/Co efflux regulator RcnB